MLQLFLNFWKYIQSNLINPNGINEKGHSDYLLTFINLNIHILHTIYKYIHICTVRANIKVIFIIILNNYI